MSATLQERFDPAELKRLLTRFSCNAAFPTLFLWYERIVFNLNPRGYLEFARDLGRLGLLPPDTADRQWTLWEDTYKLARPGANFGYEAQAYVIFVIPVIFLAWHQRARSRTPADRSLFTALLALAVSGLFISLSRTGTVTFAACLFLGTPGTRKFLYLGIGAAFVAALVALFPDNYFLARYTMRTADAYPFAEKLVQIARGLNNVFTHPLALVFGNPSLVDKDSGGFNPHNQFIYDLMAKGAFAVYFAGAMFARFSRLLSGEARAGGGDAGLAKALWLGLVAIFINCLSTQVLSNSNTAIMLWLIVFVLLQIVGDKKALRIAWS